jgi:hypothetical protein
MHGRAPHARVAFGLGRSRAAGGAGRTEVESLPLQLRRPALLLPKEAERCRERELLPVSAGGAGRTEDENLPLLLRRPALAAAGGGGVLRGEVAAARERRMGATGPPSPSEEPPRGAGVCGPPLQVASQGGAPRAGPVLLVYILRVCRVSVWVCRRGVPGHRPSHPGGGVRVGLGAPRVRIATTERSSRRLTPAGIQGEGGRVVCGVRALACVISAGRSPWRPTPQARGGGGGCQISGPGGLSCARTDVRHPGWVEPTEADPAGERRRGRRPGQRAGGPVSRALHGWAEPLEADPAGGRRQGRRLGGVLGPLSGGAEPTCRRPDLSARRTAGRSP